jgi:methylenetetrahydrofolate reductase (NADPH)
MNCCAESADSQALRSGDYSAVEIQRETNRLLSHSAIELSSNGESTIRKAAEILPPGTRVFVPKMPTQTLEHKIEQIRLLKEVGLDPIPHIVARQLSSEEQLQSFLELAVSEGGVNQVLVIGGDGMSPMRPFTDAAALIASGLLPAAGIRKVGVGGYPDGHPDISDAVLRSDLEAKVEIADDQGLELSIVTQFSFAPDRIVEYCDTIGTWAPGIPVYAGLAGPTNPAQLLRFAKICGVSMSLRGANKLGFNAIKLASNSGPDKQVDVLARGKVAAIAGNLAGIHLFSFGGFVQSSQWLRDRSC